MNLSSINIPHNIQCLLQLGDNFSLSSNNKKRIINEFIKNIENNIKKLSEPFHKMIRNSTSIINNFASFSPYISPIDNCLLNNYRDTKQFLQKNPNIILTRADKGNITVALDKETYKLKINEILQDDQTYVKVNRDPSRTMINDLETMFTKWKNLEYYRHRF